MFPLKVEWERIPTRAALCFSCHPPRARTSQAQSFRSMVAFLWNLHCEKIQETKLGKNNNFYDNWNHLIIVKHIHAVVNFIVLKANMILIYCIIFLKPNLLRSSSCLCRSASSSHRRCRPRCISLEPSFPVDHYIQLLSSPCLLVWLSEREWRKTMAVERAGHGHVPWPGKHFHKEVSRQVLQESPSLMCCSSALSIHWCCHKWKGVRRCRDASRVTSVLSRNAMARVHATAFDVLSKLLKR